jgi:hypothetical protein
MAIDKSTPTDTAFGDLKKYAVAPDSPAITIGNVGAATLAITPLASPYHPKLGLGTKPTDPKYASPPKKPEGENAAAASRKQNAPDADKPTVAAADPSLDLPAAIKKIDPLGKAQVLMNFASQLGLAVGVMNSTNKTPTNKTVTDSFSGALAILSKKLTCKKVVDAFDAILVGNNIQKISPDYQEIVKNALASFIQNVTINGEANIEVYTPPVVVYGVLTPLPAYVKLSSQIPDLYIQQYYATNEEPYIGYIEWLSPDGNTKYYVKRNTDDCPYQSIDEEQYSVCVTGLANELAIHITKDTLTIEILNTLLIKYTEKASSLGAEKNLGKNALNPAQLLSLLGVAGQLLQTAKSLHLPTSVLDTGTVNEALDGFAKGMAVVQKIKSITSTAFDLPSAVGGLASIGGLAGGLGGLSSSLGAIGSIGSITGAIGGITGGIDASLVNSLSSISAVAGLTQQATSTISNISYTMSAAGSAVDTIRSTQSLLSKIL